MTKYADTLNNQNNRSYITEKTDTFGLGARLLGRPFDFLGDTSAPTAVRTQLASNKVDSLCVPGRDSAGKSETDDLNSTPANRRAALSLLALIVQQSLKIIPIWIKSKIFSVEIITVLQFLKIFLPIC